MYGIKHIRTFKAALIINLHDEFSTARIERLFLDGPSHSPNMYYIRFTKSIELQDNLDKRSEVFPAEMHYNDQHICRTRSPQSVSGNLDEFLLDSFASNNTDLLLWSQMSSWCLCPVPCLTNIVWILNKHNIPIMRTCVKSTYPWLTVYPKKYAHGFVVLCFVVVVQSFIMNSHEVFIHIHQGCFAGTGAIVRLPQCQWSKPDGYGKISQCITTTKHSKAKTVCTFLGIYCSARLLYLYC